MACSETDAETILQLDNEFEQYLAEMKPHVLRLPHKSECQRCALWIKKLCEQCVPGITGRKNRNLYSQLLLHMLKKGTLEGPFVTRPEEGPLATLPAYMSIYFDEPGNVKGPEEQLPIISRVPDWVSDLGDGQRSGSDGERLAKSRSPTMGRRTQSATRLAMTGSRSPSPTTRSRSRSPRSKLYGERVKFSKDDAPVVRRKVFQISSDEDEAVEVAPTTRRHSHSPRKLLNPAGDTLSSLKSYRDEQSLVRIHEKELEMKTKILEAKFHEEKLKLQQRHDTAVQKILDRKNAEIEDVKGHYRSKAKDQEDSLSKMERKLHALTKELSTVKDNKEKQITDLKRAIEETDIARRTEYEQRLQDAVSEFEQEKIDLQKQHTANIQELLEDTNARLQKMEDDYSLQAAQTNAVIKELEARVQTLTADAEVTTQLKNQLEKERSDLQMNNEKLNSDLLDTQQKLSLLEREHKRSVNDFETEIRTSKNKHDAQFEFLKQEHALAAAKSADITADLESHVAHLKQAMQELENQRTRQIREMEQVQQQDKLHLEHLHEKKINGLQKEMEQQDQESQRKIRRLELTVRENEEEIQRLSEQNKLQAQQAEQALEEFKTQVERNSGRMYDDMKHQMEMVEADLNKSKELREKQSQEFNRRVEEIKQKHEQEMAALKVQFEHERSQLIHNHHTERELFHTEHEQELASLREHFTIEKTEIEERSKNQRDRDSKMIAELEQSVRQLREEVMQSNQLRKQQLVELGLLREEEKQKIQRDHESQINKLRCQLDQQRIDLQKQHSVEMERELEKTNNRLRDIEKEYSLRNQKALETISELNSTVDHMRQEHKSEIVQREQHFQEVFAKQEDDKRSLNRQHAITLQSLQEQLESQHSLVQNLERKLQEMDVDHEHKMIHVKMLYEKRIKGLLPVAMQKDLEETIISLKSQVNSLQQRSSLLQDELDRKDGYLGPRHSSPIKLTS
ncbi:centrosomal protein of 112 kDa-like [Tubulanus polymorphus]|uniref:centrosomal protein of 112 kDa-like n=1 Tax=Tubulanus polymorphus TaxID=672921 RepID=UPI003DA43C8E